MSHLSHHVRVFWASFVCVVLSPSWLNYYIYIDHNLTEGIFVLQLNLMLWLQWKPLEKPQEAVTEVGTKKTTGAARRRFFCLFAGPQWGGHEGGNWEEQNGAEGGVGCRVDFSIGSSLGVLAGSKDASVILVHLFSSTSTAVFDSIKHNWL